MSDVRMRGVLTCVLMVMAAAAFVTLPFQLPRLSPIEWLNAMLCVAGVLATLAAINRMTIDTEPQIVLSFVIIAVGLLGAVWAYFHPGDWLACFDTLIYGGFLALIVGTRRRTKWLDPRWIRPISVAISLAVGVAFFVGVS